MDMDDFFEAVGAQLLTFGVGVATPKLLAATNRVSKLGIFSSPALEGSAGVGVGAESVAKTMRFTELATGATKAEVRELLKSSNLEISEHQVAKIKDLLGSGRMDKINIKLTQSGDLRFAAERAGRDSGYQRMSFEINSQGQTTKVVQTAFDDANNLVRQRPGETKNNLYDVKKWKNKL